MTFDVYRTFKVISVATRSRMPALGGIGSLVGAIVARVRERAKEAAARLGLMPQARRLQRLLGSRTTRRDLRDNEHLRLLLAFVLREDANCIDVGANVGEILEEIVRVAPRGRHIAYEPLPDHAADLAKRFPGVDDPRGSPFELRGPGELPACAQPPGHERIAQARLPGRRADRG